MQLIQQVVIPEYIIRVKMADARRKRYYSKKSKKTWNYDKLEGKYEPITQDYDGPPYKLPAPKSKLIKVYTGEYEWYNNYLRDVETQQRIVANPGKAGEPRYRKLSGNDFASGYGSPHIRAKLVRKLKDFYRPYVREMNPITEFPIWVDWHIYTTIPDRLFDLSNFWFYYKYFEDCLFEDEDQDGNDIEPIIPDDNVKYVTKPGTAPILHPIQNWENRKFIFKFYHDDRAILRNHELYKGYYEED